MKFSEKVRKLRIRKGLSQEELALYTTSKEHKATIKKYIDQYNGNVQMAINAFCHAQNK